MEKRNPKLSLNRKTLVLLLLFVFYFLQVIECRETTTNDLHRSIHHYDRIDTQSPSPSPPRVSEFNHRLRRILLGVLFGSLTGFITTVVFAFLVKFFLQYMNTTPILKGSVVFSPEVSHKTLELALSNGLQLLGSSANGKYYKAVLDNGLTVAVKRLEPFENGENSNSPHSNSAKRVIQRELEVLARVNHRNVMSLRAYVRETDQFSLVYDYVRNGSLEDAMKRVRSNQIQLDWETRHQIAVGVIKGLRYLHFECGSRVLHYDLKPSNVLLDAEFEPRLSDCGLAKIMPNVGRLAAAGYVAPECLQSCRYTDKSDIFSFGVILGVLLTGRDPLDSFFTEVGGGSLGRWLRHLQQTGEAREGLDKSILGEEGEEGEMLMAVRIAVVCLSDLPADRPSSDELVPMLAQLHSF